MGNGLLFPGSQTLRRPDGKSYSEGTELYFTDGTAKGTRLVKDILDTPGDQKGSCPEFLTRCGKKVIFMLGNPGPLYEPAKLWESDGTEAGTKFFAELPDGAFPRNFVSIGDGVAFIVSRRGVGQDLWWTDGTKNGTREILRLNGLNYTQPQEHGGGIVICGSERGSTDARLGMWWWDLKGAKPILLGSVEHPTTILTNQKPFAILPAE
jgi:ELWxxDGT repeat protein